MRFLIITHVLHKSKDQQWFGYAPYVREMNLWLKHVDEVEIVAPISQDATSAIDIAYQHDAIRFTKIPSIALVNFSNALLSLFALPLIIFKLFKACRRADHIHLRCPGNIGLLGCLVQVFFPKKIKTAKYAGNWDPNASQPFSYRLQKKLLSNTKWTKNMTVIVYGEWNNQTKNIKSFFTATYKNEDKEVVKDRNYKDELNFVFVGSLVEGKRPLLAIKIVEALQKKGHNVVLNLFGDGVLRQELEDYCNDNNLNDIIKINGNQTSQTVKEALKVSHFTILASKSEGWPKALAEAMFFGIIPIATSISCVPNMLGEGKRGILITPTVEDAIIKIEAALTDEKELKQTSMKALKWSQQYTLDVFESEIKKLIVA